MTKFTAHLLAWFERSLYAIVTCAMIWELFADADKGSMWVPFDLLVVISFWYQAWSVQVVQVEEPPSTKDKD